MWHGRPGGGSRNAGGWFLAAALLCLAFSVQAVASQPIGEQVHEFHITETNAATALNQFAEQSGVVLLYPYAVVKEKQTRPVIGRYGLTEALQLLLNGSGLKGGLTERGTIKISLADGDTVKTTGGTARMNTEKDSLRARIAAVIVSIFGASEAAHAQDAGSVRPAIDEIVVTAQKREQNLQDVPIVVSAISAGELSAHSVSAFEDLGQVTPGLTIQRQQAAVFPVIRGIGYSIAVPGNESSVSTYVDGFYHASPIGLNTSFNNVERVEVLKGPQGTLFGRNATGGLVNIITRRPSAEPSADVSLSYGSYDTIEGNFYGTMGLSDNLAVDLALYGHDRRDGFGDNLTTGSDTYTREDRMARVSFLYTPSEQTEVRLSIDNVQAEGSEGEDRQVDKGSRTADGAPPPDDFFDTRNQVDNSIEIEQTGVGLKISHDFNGYSMQSLTAYRESESIAIFDQDSTPVDFVHTPGLDDYTTTFSQELQLLSGPDAPFEWILGAFYYNGDAEYDPIHLAGILFNPVGGSIVRHTSQKTESYAAFGQATFDLWEDTSLTTGLRYTTEEREFDGRQTTGSGLMASFKDDISFNEVTWRLALAHDFSDDMMAYISYNRGFKSGIYPTDSVSPQPVDPEVLDAYEIGLKTTLLDRRVVLNTSAYFYDYTDLQVNVPVPGGQLFQNAAEAEVMGAEIELQASPTENLSLRVGLSFIDSEFTDFPDAVISMPRPAPAGGNATSTGSVKGNELSRAPKFTGTFNVIYTIPTDTGSWELAGSYFYNDGFFWEPENRLEQDAYSLVNASVKWTTPNDRFSVRLYGTNLTDEEYSRFANSGGFGDLISAAAPREYGIGVAYRFE